MSKQANSTTSNRQINRNNRQYSIYTDPQLQTVIQNRITTLLNRQGGEWRGTMTQLELALRTVSRAQTPENWAATPSVMRKVINRMVRKLSRDGVRVSFERDTSHTRNRVVSLITR